VTVKRYRPAEITSKVAPFQLTAQAFNVFNHPNLEPRCGGYNSQRDSSFKRLSWSSGDRSLVVDDGSRGGN
jgi:hypothetical protein